MRNTISRLLIFSNCVKYTCIYIEDLSCEKRTGYGGRKEGRWSELRACVHYNPLYWMRGGQGKRKPVLNFWGNEKILLQDILLYRIYTFHRILQLPR